MSGFSLGAAIGATGKFPKLKIAAEDTAASDRQAKELAAIRSKFTLDGQGKYHNVYLNNVADEHAAAVQELMQLEKNKDPEVITKAYNLAINLDKKRQYADIMSKDLFNIERTIREGDRKSIYMPSYYNDIIEPALRTSKSEEDLFNKLKQHPEIFKDGFFTFKDDEGGLKRLNVRFDKRIDFEKLMSSTDMFSLEDHGVEFREDKQITDKERTIERYISIPRDKDEARKLKETNPDVKIENNAYDLGKIWFTNSKSAQDQYRSILYQNGKLKDGDEAETNVDKLYDSFYKDYVITNIPAKKQNIDKTVPRFTTNVFMGDGVAPTTFQSGPSSSNYGDDPTDELYTADSIAASPEASGADVQLPQNKYAISLISKAPEFTGTAMKTFRISRIGLYPTIKASDPYGNTVLVPLSQKQKQQYDADGKKYLMVPFALAVDKPLNIGVMPDISKATYVIPLYEPGPDGRWVVPQSVRKAKDGAGSPTLDQILKGTKWDQRSRDNWNVKFFDLMSKIVDENDLATKK